MLSRDERPVASKLHSNCLFVCLFVCSLFVVRCSLCVVCCVLFVVRCSLVVCCVFVVCCVLCVVCCVLCVVCCVLCVCVVCCVVRGVWCVVCGVWCLVCGVWCVVCGVCGVVLWLLLLFGTLLNVCVYIHSTSRVALSYLLILGVQTWRRGPALAPGIIPPQSCFEQEHDPHHADRIASSYNQHRKQLNVPHDATSSTHVAETEPVRCAGVFLFSRILFLPGPEPLTQ